MTVSEGQVGEQIHEEIGAFQAALKAVPTVEFKSVAANKSCDTKVAEDKKIELADDGKSLRVAFRIVADACPGPWDVEVKSDGKLLGKGVFRVNPVSVRPFNATSSLVTVLVDRKVLNPDVLGPDVVAVGSTVYGLRNAPYFESAPDHVTILVPNVQLSTYRTLTWQTLLGQPQHFGIPFSPPASGGASDFAITAITPITAAASSGGPGSTGSTPSAASSKPSPTPSVQSDVSVPAIVDGKTVTAKGLGLLTIGDGTPAITAVSPAGGQPDGKPIAVKITGAFTKFDQDKSTFRFSTDITYAKFNVWTTPT